MSRYQNYDPKIISVFEVVGSYFVDTFFNHVYASAKANLTSGASLTDEYTRRVQSYVIGVKNDAQCYGDVVSGVHQHFTILTRYVALSFADFVDKIVGVCVPEDYYRNFSAQDKDELLSSILCDLVSNLAAFATKPDNLRRVIDEHEVNAQVTIRMLQNAAVDALVAKRGALHNQFLRKAGQARNHVSMDVVDEMKKALRRLVKEKAAQKARADDAEEALEDLKAQVKALRARDAKLRKLIALMRTGRDSGATAAIASYRIPQPNTLAEEDPLAIQPESRVPRRERIAERRGEDEDEDEDEDDEEDEEGEDEYEDEEPPRRGKGHQAPSRRVPAKTPAKAPAPVKAPAVTANFFKGAAPLRNDGGVVTAASLRTVPAKTTTRPGAKPAPTATNAKPAPVQPTSRPPMLANLMDNVVDSTGDTDIDNLLNGGYHQ